MLVDVCSFDYLDCYGYSIMFGMDMVDSVLIGVLLVD